MNLDEIKAFLQANGSTPEVIAFLATLSPVTTERARVFLETTDEGKRLVTSLTDQKVTQGIATFKANNLDSLISAEYAKRHPEETPEQKRIRTLEQKIEESDRKILSAGLKAKALAAISGKKINGEILELLAIGDNEEAVNTNVAKFVTVFEAAVAEQVAAKFKDNGRTPPLNDNTSDYKGKNPFSKEHFNLTSQAKLQVENPELAKQLKAAAQNR